MRPNRRPKRVCPDVAAPYRLPRPSQMDKATVPPLEEAHFLRLRDDGCDELRRRRRVAGAVSRIGAERRAVAARHDQMPQALAPVRAPGLGERGAVEVGLEVAHRSWFFGDVLRRRRPVSALLAAPISRCAGASRAAQIDGQEGLHLWVFRRDEIHGFGSQCCENAAATTSTGLRSHASRAKRPRGVQG